MVCEGKASSEKEVEIDDSPIQDSPNVEFGEENKGQDEEDIEMKRAKLEPLKVNSGFLGTFLILVKILPQCLSC